MPRQKRSEQGGMSFFAGGYLKADRVRLIANILTFQGQEVTTTTIKAYAEQHFAYYDEDIQQALSRLLFEVVIQKAFPAYLTEFRELYEAPQRIANRQRNEPHLKSLGAVEVKLGEEQSELIQVLQQTQRGVLEQEALLLSRVGSVVYYSVYTLMQHLRLHITSPQVISLEEAATRFIDTVKNTATLSQFPLETVILAAHRKMGLRALLQHKVPQAELLLLQDLLPSVV